MDLSWLPDEIIFEIMKFMRIRDVLIFNCFPRLNKLFDEYIKCHYLKNKKLKKISDMIKIDILLLYEDPQNIYEMMFDKYFRMCKKCKTACPKGFYMDIHKKQCLCCFKHICIYNSIVILKSEYKYFDLFPNDYINDKECFLCKYCFGKIYRYYGNNIKNNKTIIKNKIIICCKYEEYHEYVEKYLWYDIQINNAKKKKIYLFHKDTDSEVKIQFGYNFGKNIINIQDSRNMR